jgi:hypothetical protein
MILGTQGRPQAPLVHRLMQVVHNTNTCDRSVSLALPTYLTNLPKSQMTACPATMATNPLIILGRRKLLFLALPKRHILVMDFTEAEAVGIHRWINLSVRHLTCPLPSYVSSLLVLYHSFNTGIMDP